MSVERTNRAANSMPWAALLAGAAVGALAIAAAKYWRTASSAAPRTLEEALRACDRAAELLDDRVAGKPKSYSLAG